MFLRVIFLFVTATLALSNGADSAQWRVTVVTSDVDRASTQAKVHINVFGTKGNTSYLPLNNEDTDLRQNSQDEFNIKTADIGTPEKLKVWHDNMGSSPEWHLTRIELMRTDDPNNKYVFDCNCWLSAEGGDGDIEKTLSLSNFQWRVLVVTAFNSAYQFNDGVYIMIIGTHGNSKPFELDSPGNDFEIGNHDHYTVTADHVGTPTKINVWHDERGGYAHSWHMERIVLTRSDKSDLTYVFECHCWLSSQSGYVKREASILLSNPQWSVQVVSSEGIGTDFGAHLQVVGTDGNSSEMALDLAKGGSMENSKSSTFFLTTKHIGTPNEIKVSLDNPASSLYLERIDMQWTGQPEISYIFSYDSWLSSQQGDKKLERAVQVSKTYWEARVRTSDIEKAGTNADISMVIFGVNGHTREIPLRSDDHSEFAIGQVGVFRFWTVDIGMPTRIRVKATYASGAVGWHLDNIQLEKTSGADSYAFKCDCWFDLKAGGGETVKEINWPYWVAIG